MPLATVPLATYRLQFNASFRIPDAAKLLPYLETLGVSHVYASPILRARAGSTHGYDGIDPTRVGPETGGAAGFRRLAQGLRRHGMGLVLDIVPNHLAATTENPWWRDVLERGTRSPRARHFDIRWTEGSGRLTLPVLGHEYPEALESGLFSVGIGPDGFSLRYGGMRLQLRSASYVEILHRAHRRLDEGSATGNETIHAGFSTAIALAEAVERKHSSSVGLQRLIWRLCEGNADVRVAIDAELAAFGGRTDDKSSFDRMHALVAAQHYRLVHWRSARDQVNYRRFFDITDLVGVRVEDPTVFDATHVLIRRLVREGLVDGLRIDHVDGLADPRSYLEALRHASVEDARAAGVERPPTYVVVEKILEGEESLPLDWPVMGTTGYEFLAWVNGLQVDRAGHDQLVANWRRITKDPRTFEQIVLDAKLEVIAELFPGELRSIARALLPLALQDRYAADIGEQEMAEAIAALTAALPIYRTYLSDAGPSQSDQAIIDAAVEEADARGIATSRALHFLERILGSNMAKEASGTTRAATLAVVRRWQQFTGPVMAKAVEDTSFYRYFPLLSANEVGANPGQPSLDADEFHESVIRRTAHWPHAMNATATHDTKRGEDARARINVLSEMPREWLRAVGRWGRLNAAHRRVHTDRRTLPGPETELLIYQTLIGAVPANGGVSDGLMQRIAQFLVKAAREAKRETSWASPDDAYEAAIEAFASEILVGKGAESFLADFLPFHRRVAAYGAVNSLAQLVLKLTVPGIPDIYQGTESWDFSLVDPDNRRPVDYPARAEMLESLAHGGTRNRPGLTREVMASWPDGRIKLLVMADGLATRRREPELFLDGDYQPLRADGAREQHVVAFARRRGSRWLLVIVPRLPMGVYDRRSAPIRPSWLDTAIRLPDDAPAQWESVFTGERVGVVATGSASGQSVLVDQVCGNFPVAMLLSS